MKMKDMYDLYPYKSSSQMRKTYTCKIIDFEYDGNWLTLKLLEMYFKQEISFCDKIDKIWKGIKCNCPQKEIRNIFRQREHKEKCLTKNISNQSKKEIRKELKEKYNGFEDDEGYWEYNDPWRDNEPYCKDYNLVGKFIQLEFDGDNWEIVEIKSSKRCVFD